jgi:hypothetical protein
MADHTTDQSVLNRIQELVAQEHRFHAQSEMTEADRSKLHEVAVELDQCWDLPRQRRALRTIGPISRRASISRLKRSSIVWRSTCSSAAVKRSTKSVAKPACCNSPAM